MWPDGPAFIPYQARDWPSLYPYPAGAQPAPGRARKSHTRARLDPPDLLISTTHRLSAPASIASPASKYFDYFPAPAGGARASPGYPASSLQDARIHGEFRPTQSQTM